MEAAKITIPLRNFGLFLSILYNYMIYSEVFYRLNTVDATSEVVFTEPWTPAFGIEMYINFIVWAPSAPKLRQISVFRRLRR